MPELVHALVEYGHVGCKGVEFLIEVSEAGAQVLGAIAAELAHGEGLQAHARAAEMRLKK